MYLSSLVLFSTEQVCANEVIKKVNFNGLVYVWRQHWEKAGVARDTTKRRNYCLLEGNRNSNEILSKSVILLTVACALKEYT